MSSINNKKVADESLDLAKNVPTAGEGRKIPLAEALFFHRCCYPHPKARESTLTAVFYRANIFWCHCSYIIRSTCSCWVCVHLIVNAGDNW
ncbi:hypothetical protein J8L86_20840 [Shewanella sp. MMG014]|uniref:hypothetical protein n=1 Tax=Shewanella sp. MMG014 TaxID=2822691 RepID=UPI001B38BFED|nr:hypothetical protein [Shewanella sp. MMG014]MBQ4892300.1 hypothetical protein [Shewanella sp. MMG014]